MFASLNHRKKMKGKPNRLIHRKLTANLKVSFITYLRLIGMHFFE